MACRVDPDRLRLGVVLVHRDPQQVVVDPESLGDQLVRPRDRVGLEVVAEREVPEHLEHRQVPGRVADVLDVVRAEALLARTARRNGGGACPRKYGMNWFMPAFASSRPDSGGGIRDDDGTRRCSRSSKNDRNVSRMRWLSTPGSLSRAAAGAAGTRADAVPRCWKSVRPAGRREVRRRELRGVRVRDPPWPGVPRRSTRRPACRGPGARPSPRARSWPAPRDRPACAPIGTR